MIMNGLGCAECGGGCGSPNPSKFVEEGLAGLGGFLGALGATVTLADGTSRSSTNFYVGDTFSLIISGAPVGSQVLVSSNGGSPVPSGMTDSNGNLTIGGTWGEGDVGSHSQVWYVGYLGANQPNPVGSLNFTVMEGGTTATATTVPVTSSIPVTSTTSVPTSNNVPVPVSVAVPATPVTTLATSPGLLDWLGLSATPVAPIIPSVPNWMLAGGLLGVLALLGGKE